MADEQQRPNIILIITDQQRYDSINALGYPYMQTPHLDKLVNEGVSFENCFVTAPSCAPSRGSLFTGYYPHVSSILKNGDVWTESWVEDLADSGYYCVNIGKMHTQPWQTAIGFQERFVVENKDRYLEGRYYFDEWDKALRARGLVKQQRELYRQHDDYHERMGAFEWLLPPEMHSDNFVGDFATWWIKNAPKRDPLFLEIGFPGPHPPYDPTPEFIEQYADVNMPSANVTAEDIAGQPSQFKQLREHNFAIDHDSVVHLDNPDEAQVQRLRQYYAANVSMIDQQVGNIMQALDEQGYLENSIIIFTSDHGDSLGDHGHIQKWTMYDEVVRVPLIVWSKSGFVADTKRPELCQLMDVGATILDIADVPISPNMQAETLYPALLNADFVGRDYVYAEHPPDGVYEGDYMTMVRNTEWKLVHFMNSGEGQLFNLSDDPQERINLWHDADYATIKSQLLLQLLDWRTNSAETAAKRQQNRA